MSENKIAIHEAVGISEDGGTIITTDGWELRVVEDPEFRAALMKAFGFVEITEGENDG